MLYGIRDATKIIFLVSPDNGATWEPSTEFSAIDLDTPMIFGERDADRVVVLTSLDGGNTWVPAEPGGVSKDPWTVWTPTFTAATTNPFVGELASTLTGRYQTLGSVIVAEGRLVWGDFASSGGTYGGMTGTYGGKASATYGTLFTHTPASVGSGIYSLDLPVNAKTTLPDHPVGQWRAKQAATGDTAFGPVVITAADEMQLVYQDAYPSGLEVFVDDSGLFAWAEGDEITWSLTYEKA